jgi:alkylation response protein AidB-like acyl-CoA dehydrogenase
MIDLLRNEHSLWRAHVSAAESAFLEKVEGFVASDVAPNADAWERAEELPRSIFERAGKIGLMGVTAPTKVGGQGFGYAAYALAIREVAKQQGALAIDIAAHNALAVGHILLHGSPLQHAAVFPRLVNGEWLGAWALTEPEAGSDSGGVETTGTDRGDGTWELNGFKRFITLGRKADRLVVMAATGTTPKGKKEISAFLVEKSQIEPLRKVPTSGLRASETSEFRLTKARAEMLGARRTGQAGPLAFHHKGRIGVGAV